MIENSEKEYMEDKDSITRLIQNADAESRARMEYELSANKVDYEEMRWLKVYAYVGMKQYSEAEQVLKDISSENGMYKAKADSLLNDM